MKLIELRMDVTINKGNYESEKVGLTALVEDGDDIFDLKKQLRNICLFDEEVGEIAETKEELPECTDVETKEPEVTKEPKKSKKESAPKKLKPKVTTPYDRTSELHKKIFTSTLNEAVPGWKVKNAAKAKTSSIALEGKEFLSEEGTVLPSFIVALVDLMK